MPRKKMAPLTAEQKKPGHFEGKFWVWADGRKTHVKFIQMAMRRNKQLPPGFYEECEKSKNPEVNKMGLIAKHQKLKELPT